ncbi:guanylate-binding protein [Pelomyxa schiedti]|nr:guanylate-binding protein [Pelomyxa schiedti]
MTSADGSFLDLLGSKLSSVSAHKKPSNDDVLNVLFTPSPTNSSSSSALSTLVGVQTSVVTPTLVPTSQITPASGVTVIATPPSQEPIHVPATQTVKPQPEPPKNTTPTAPTSPLVSTTPTPTPTSLALPTNTPAKTPPAPNLAQIPVAQSPAHIPAPLSNTVLPTPTLAQLPTSTPSSTSTVATISPPIQTTSQKITAVSAAATPTSLPPVTAQTSAAQPSSSTTVSQGSNAPTSLGPVPLWLQIIQQQEAALKAIQQSPTSTPKTATAVQPPTPTSPPSPNSTTLMPTSASAASTSATASTTVTSTSPTPLPQPTKILPQSATQVSVPSPQCQCPICGASFAATVIDDHVNTCLSKPPPAPVPQKIPPEVQKSVDSILECIPRLFPITLSFGIKLSSLKPERILLVLKSFNMDTERALDYCLSLSSTPEPNVTSPPITSTPKSTPPALSTTPSTTSPTTTSPSPTSPVEDPNVTRWRLEKERADSQRALQQMEKERLAKIEADALAAKRIEQQEREKNEREQREKERADQQIAREIDSAFRQANEAEAQRRKAEAEAQSQAEIIKLLLREKEEAEKKARELEKSGGQEEIQYLPGEKEALEGDTLRIFTLHPERHFSNTAGQMHFRTAESQFYRLIANNTNFKVTKVEYIVNPPHVKAFRRKRAQLATKMPWSETNPILVFHGTAEENITSIVRNNFQLRYVGSSTDSGWWGAGIYFSEFPSLSMGYVRSGSKFLLAQVLLGKPFLCTDRMDGAAKVPGYDSHISPDKTEIIIFDSDQILPYYVIHYGATVTYNDELVEPDDYGYTPPKTTTTYPPVYPIAILQPHTKTKCPKGHKCKDRSKHHRSKFTH